MNPPPPLMNTFMSLSFRPRSMAAAILTARAGEERLHVGELARPLHGRQAVEELPAIGLLDHPRIAEHQHPAVVLVADQPAGALLERDRRLRQLEVDERIAPFA